jgi:NhaP-type Na+/H+ or K+/H+ antiporter
MDWAQNRDLMQEAAGAVVFLVTAFAAYLFAVLIHGNGFIAAFVAGMVFGNSYRHNIHFISEFMEGAGQLLTMAAFLVFGAFLLPDGLAHAGVSTLVLALLFLTVVRMGPILLSLIGSGLLTGEKLFLGWFGPRGLASILFTLLMMDQFDIPNEEELLACVSLTVGLSILLHGITSTPLASWISQEGKRNT